MKRWAGAFSVVLLFCAFVFAGRSQNASLLKDTDTATLLSTLHERQSPLSWFVGDWPLGNHFYRPISTLTFEADLAVYGRNAAGYGATNAIIAILCILALFWFLRELTDNPATSCAGAAVFAAWHLHSNVFGWVLFLLSYAVYAVPLGALLPGRRVLPNLLAMAVAAAAVIELQGENFSLWTASLDWLPGRTATTMTVFALAACACYARFERLGAKRIPPSPSPMDPPATKSAGAAREGKKSDVGWAGGACVFAALALGCYEQAVMLPAILFGIATAFRMRGFRVRWGWQAAFWGVLFAYLSLRYAVVPVDASGYQRQQFRSGAGVWVSITDLVLPCLLYLRGTLSSLEFGLANLFMSQTYLAVWVTCSNVATAWVARLRLPLFLVGWVLSVVSFLPMAWLKPFPHYYYWPAAFRSILVVTLFAIAGDLIVTAWSRPALQAPPRSDPAPGSLPRR